MVELIETSILRSESRLYSAMTSMRIFSLSSPRIPASAHELEMGRDPQDPPDDWVERKARGSPRHLLRGGSPRSDTAALGVFEECKGGSDAKPDTPTRESREGGVRQWKKEIFNELLGSVREAGAILRGQRKPSRRTVLGPSGVRAIRDRTHLSQSEFAFDGDQR